LSGMNRIFSLEFKDGVVRRILNGESVSPGRPAAGHSICAPTGCPSEADKALDERSGWIKVELKPRAMRT
jgi:hypothetical protein